ncbi:MAG: YicC family protein [Bacteroidetes bacterium]|nr:YicC family protein [Bacteroidota bacterium]
MIRSMTGFGNAVAEFGSKTISVDIRSLNSKFFDLTLRVPSAYREKDMEMRTMLSRELERGKVEVYINIDSSEPMRKSRINKDIVRQYHAELKALNEELKIDTDDYLGTILRLPDALNMEEAHFDEEEWKQINETLQSAMKAFNAFRDKEGKFMEKDLRERIDAIEENLKKIEPLEEGRIENIRKRLADQLKESAAKDAIDKNRFEQEVLYYLEKMDVTEEKVRLRSHCIYFFDTMNEPQSNGKKIGFITQEMGREINTLGAKANDAVIQKFVVQMKDELEKIKELMMNIL